MPPSRQPWAAARGARIFGGFPRFFGSMPESGFLQPASTASASNPMFHGQRIRCRSSRPATGAANFPEKLTGGQRITGRGMFQGISGRRGAAGLTGLILGLERPLAGIKKPPPVMYQRGRCGLVWGLNVDCDGCA